MDRSNTTYNSRMAADAETKTATDQQFMFKIPTDDIIISSDV